MLFFSHGQVAASIRVLITRDRCCHEGILITESCFDESAGLHLTILGISAASYGYTMLGLSLADIVIGL